MPDKDYLVPAGLGPPTAAFSHAIRCGETLYLAGQCAFDETNGIVGIGDPKKQAEQCWHNIDCVVRSAGGSVADIVKIQVFLKDIRYAEFEEEVRLGYFARDRLPACTLIQAANLGMYELLMEIDAIAVLRSRD